MKRQIIASSLTMLVFSTGCREDIQDITFTTGTIGTVVTAEWTSAVPGEGTVLYDVNGITRQATALRADSVDGDYTYTATLLGLRVNESYEATVQVTADGETSEATSSFDSGGLSVALPGLTTEGTSSIPEGYILTAFAQDPAAAFIIDAEGEYVWAYEETEANRALAEVYPDPANNALVFASFDPDQTNINTTSDLVRVSLDGDTVERMTLDNLHHDFLIHEDGTIAYIAYDSREIDGDTWRGDQIIELAADGSSTVVWSSWDHVPFDENVTWSGPDWTHANAINYDADEDVYYLSLYAYGAILKIDRASGNVEWTLGGVWSDFDVDPAHELIRQHQFDLIDGGLLVFNNGLVNEQLSVAQEFSLDPSSGTADVVWTYSAGTNIFSAVLGDVERLSNDSTLVTFSTAGLIDEVDPSGNLTWRLEGAFGSVFGYSRHMTDLQELVGQ